MAIEPVAIEPVAIEPVAIEPVAATEAAWPSGGYVVDPSSCPWRDGETEGVTFRGQVLLSGDDGGPEAFRFRFDPCLSVYAHMHLVSQFQLLLGGSMDLPRESMRLRPIGVHYTDHNRPYGPFAVGGNHEVLVLHPRRGGLVSMRDRPARRQIFLRGRELSGRSDEVPWLSVVGQPALRHKVLFAPTGGPSAVLVELMPGAVMPTMPAVHGRYDVVIEGCMIFDGTIISPPGLRYVHESDTSASAVAGGDGATVAMLSFDSDALEGGLLAGDEVVALAAHAAMARAI